jgi:hypothetical protein
MSNHAPGARNPRRTTITPLELASRHLSGAMATLDHIDAVVAGRDAVELLARLQDGSLGTALGQLRGCFGQVAKIIDKGASRRDHRSELKTV